MSTRSDNGRNWLLSVPTSLWLLAAGFAIGALIALS
jgi:hypothetical protein